MSIIDAVLEHSGITSISSPPGILIAYDSDNERFSVASADTQCGYFVPRGDVVGNYRNFGEVVDEIMSACEKEMVYELLIDLSAEDEINRILSPRLTISYDTENNRFCVTFMESGWGYFVSRNDLVGDYRNEGEVVDELMSGSEQGVNYERIIELSAKKAIRDIWEANIVLFS